MFQMGTNITQKMFKIAVTKEGINLTYLVEPHKRCSLKSLMVETEESQHILRRNTKHEEFVV